MAAVCPRTRVFLPLATEPDARDLDVFEPMRRCLNRLRAACDAAGIRVEYRQEHDGTLLVFHRNDAFAGAGEGLPSHGEGINETVNETVNSDGETVSQRIGRERTALRDEGELLSLILRDPGVTYDAMAEATGFSRAKVARLMRGLRERGVVERVGSDKAGSWRIVQGRD